MIKTLLSFILIISVLSSCSTNAISSTERNKIYYDFIHKNKLPVITKVSPFRLKGWVSLDNRHLLVSSTFQKSYLISLKSYCTDLKYADKIILKRSSPSVLKAQSDYIIVPGVSIDHGFTEGVRTVQDRILDPTLADIRCHIKSIHLLNENQVDKISSLVKNTP